MKPIVFKQGVIDNYIAEFVPQKKSIIKVDFSLVIPFVRNHVALVYVNGRGWCIPSGKVQEGESPEDAAHRELREEASLHAEELTLLGHFVLNGVREKHVANLYMARVTEPEEFQDTDECLGRLLVHPIEIKQYYYIWNPLISKVFKYANAKRLFDAALTDRP